MTPVEKRVEEYAREFRLAAAQIRSAPEASFDPVPILLRAFLTVEAETLERCAKIIEARSGGPEDYDAQADAQAIRQSGTLRAQSEQSQTVKS